MATGANRSSPHSAIYQDSQENDCGVEIGNSAEALGIGRFDNPHICSTKKPSSVYPITAFFNASCLIIPIANS
jgi:hypothetical protein